MHLILQVGKLVPLCCHLNFVRVGVATLTQEARAVGGYGQGMSHQADTVLGSAQPIRPRNTALVPISDYLPSFLSACFLDQIPVVLAKQMPTCLACCQLTATLAPSEGERGGTSLSTPLREH